MRSQYNTSFKKLFNEGKLLFNSGEFYDAHIVWEHIWKEGDAEEKILKVSFSYRVVCSIIALVSAEQQYIYWKKQEKILWMQTRY